MRGEKEALESCYEKSLILATAYNCKSIAFPLISAGVYGYPQDKAIMVAANTIGKYLQTHDIAVYLVLFGDELYRYARYLLPDPNLF